MMAAERLFSSEGFARERIGKFTKRFAFELSLES